MAGDDSNPPLPSAPHLDPNDTFLSMEAADTTVILQTEGTYALDAVQGFQTKKLRIYAETVTLSGNLVLPSKDIGIFCNKFSLKSSTANISVSGKSGVDGSDPAGAGKGQNSGSISMYIEQFDETLLPRKEDNEQKGLFLKAFGGNGGRGIDSVTSQGGKGGDGGNGGQLRFYFGAVAAVEKAELVNLFKDKMKSFRGKAKELSEKFASNEGGSSIKSHADAFEKSAAGIEQFMANVDSVVSIFKPAPDDTISSQADLQEAVSTALRLDSQPRVDDASYIASQTALEATISKFANIPIDAPEKPWEELTSNMNAMKEALGKATNNPYSADEGNRSALGTALADYCAGIQDELDQKVGNMRFSYTCRNGAAGAGGKGVSPDQPGAPGTAGKPGKATVKAINLTDQDADLKIPVVYAHPDQCQMLSNIADHKYLSAKRSTDLKNRYSEAREFYDRLKKRLAFVPAFVEKLKDTKEDELKTISSTMPLLDAYLVMESEYLTLDSLAQLSQIRLHAVVGLSRIDQGHDMFGHDGLWAPRLNYNFFTESIEDARVRAQKIAEKIEEAGPTISAYDAEESLANSKAHLSALSGRIRTLTERDSGTLATIASQIQAYTPLLKAKRVEVKSALEKVSNDIDKSINWDPKIAIDAISMIAFAPDGLNIIAQGGGAVYKAMTTVRSADGTAVEKSYVVEQFGEVTSDVSKLQHTLSQTSKGEMAVDDPGATKLLASKAEIDKLIKNYKLAISKENLSEVRFLFDQYVDLALHRNNAVIEYNANVQILLKLVEDEKYYQKRLNTVGHVKAVTDTRVYTLKLFLAKSRYDIRKTIHEVLYNAERALQFWSLCDDLPEIEPSANFSDISLLEARCKVFEDELKKATTRMAGNPGSIFPHPKHLDLGGIRWEMPTTKVEALRNNKSVDADSNTVYQILFNILPARKATKKLPKRERGSPVPTPLDLKPKGLNGAAESNFTGMADVRIDQVKAWLFGAKVDEPDGGTSSLQCTLEHLGDDYIVRGEGDKIFEFNHGITKLKWRYNPVGVDKWEDTSKAAIFEEQLIPSFRGPNHLLQTNSVAPIGPFATWRLTVTDQHNLGLNLEGLKAVTLEFCGTAASF